MSGYMQLAAASALGLFATASFAGETIDFTYDKKGRVTGVTHTGGPANGVSASYTYDDAQNRTNVTVTVPGAPPPSSTVIQLSSGSGVNLRSLANANGYAGATGVSYTFVAASGVTITGAANSGIGIDTGSWPAGVTLLLTVNGTVRGGGGKGGNGASATYNAGSTTTSQATSGGAGGDAIRCNAPVTVSVGSGGLVQAGGGGGGGGGVNATSGGPSGPVYIPGGGGGGGAPNGGGGSAGTGYKATATAGSPGSATGGGAPGSGTAGGPGGNYAVAGMNGTNGGLVAAGSGGPAGYAVRKNGTGCTASGAGTITGTVG